MSNSSAQPASNCRNPTTWPDCRSTAYATLALRFRQALGDRQAAEDVGLANQRKADEREPAVEREAARVAGQRGDRIDLAARDVDDAQVPLP